MRPAAAPIPTTPVQIRPVIQLAVSSAQLPVGAATAAEPPPATPEADPNRLDGSQVGRDPQIQTPKPRISELKRLLRHTNSLNQLPEFGVETEHGDQLKVLMEQIDVWGLNIFEVHKFSQQHSLTTVVYKIFKVS